MSDPTFEGQSFTVDQFEDMKHAEILDADPINNYPSQPRFIRLWWSIVRCWQAVVTLSNTATIAADVATTKAAEAAASAAAADLFDPSNYVAKAGDAMTGALEVPAGASGNQAPRVSEVVKKSGDTMTGALEVPAGASGNQAPRVSEVVKKSGDTLTGYLVGILGAVGLQIPTMDDVIAYVSEMVGSKKWKESAIAATTAALPACTYANGSSGVGATLTGNSNGALAAIDGVTLTLNQDLLVKDEPTALRNGIYRLTQVGSAGTPFILTRRTDANTASKLVAATLLIEQGTNNGDTQWTCSNDSITVGTTALTLVLTGGKKSVTTDGNQTLTNKTLLQPNILQTIIATSASTYVMLAGDDVINIDASGGARAVTPLSAAGYSGKSVEVRKTDSSFNEVTITGVTKLHTQGEAVTLISDGTNWSVNNRYIPAVKTSYTPTVTHNSGAMTNVAHSGMWKRIGDEIEIDVFSLFSGATGTWSNVFYSIPAGLTVDTAKILSTVPINPVGAGSANDAALGYYNLTVDCFTNTTFAPYLQTANATYVYVTNGLLSNTAPFTFASGDSIRAKARLPIVGWNG